VYLLEVILREVVVDCWRTLPSYSSRFTEENTKIVKIDSCGLHEDRTRYVLDLQKLPLYDVADDVLGRE
jgi:hypothetical protein